MHPILFKLGPVTVYSYGFTVALAFFITSSLIIRRAKLEKVDSKLLSDLCFYLLVGGILGARILYCLVNARDYLSNPKEIFMLHHGGLSFYGGLISAAGSGILFLKKRNLPVWKIVDIVTVYLALGQAIGRIGCFLNGCCYGKQSLFLGVYFPGSDFSIYPVQIYESLANLGIFLILATLREKPHKEGRIFILYLLFYSSVRFFLEFLRGDNPPFLLGLTLYQIISIIIFSIFFLSQSRHCFRC